MNQCNHGISTKTKTNLKQSLAINSVLVDCKRSNNNNNFNNNTLMPIERNVYRRLFLVYREVGEKCDKKTVSLPHFKYTGKHEPLKIVIGFRC